jgi:hypothetical protein
MKPRETKKKNKTRAKQKVIKNQIKKGETAIKY